MQLYDFVTSSHNRRFQIDVLALQALLYDSQGEGTAALESLTNALQLAEPGGFIRPFVDLGPPMADLLKRLHRKKIARDYEPLTNRELDVLELLAQRLSNKEIAEKLFISGETIKSHLKNIYQKLEVKKRREAVEKAKKVGIL